MAQIEERLDEISRAIAASSRTAEPQFDAEPFERIEARMASLARQVEELADDRPAAEVLSRINTLSARVDDIAQRVEIPQSVMERLSSQMALISAKLETKPEAPDSDALMRGIDQRFDRLSEALAQRQGDALEQGQGLVRELERRLGQVADRLEHHEGTAVDAGLVEAMEKRLAALQSRLEETSGLQLDPASLRSLEGRLDDISHRLETQVAGAPGLDPEIARNLEEQVAVLSQQLAKPGKATADFDEIGPRLDSIEQSIAGSREALLQAARRAAEEAVNSIAGSGPANASVSALADDLRALDTLARRSDERNSKTFEAIHDTLLKIVERLGALEQGGAALKDEGDKLAVSGAPSIEPDERDPFVGPESPPKPSATARMSPAEAATAAASAALEEGAGERAPQAAAKTSMLGGLTRVLTGRKEREAAAQEPKARASEAADAALDTPLDPKTANEPLEPGSGTPDLNAIMRRVRDERGPGASSASLDAGKSDFIAAARRAAQAAAAEAETIKHRPSMKMPARGLKFGDILKGRTKPVLIGATALLVVLAALQLGKAFLSGGSHPHPAAVSAVTPKATPELKAEAIPSETAAPKPAGKTGQDHAATADANHAMQATPASPQHQADKAAASSTAPQPALEADAKPVPAPAAQVPAPSPRMATPAPSSAAGDSAASGAAPTPSDQTVAAIEPDHNAAPAASAPAAATPNAASGAQNTQVTQTAMAAPADIGPVALREAADAGDPKAMFEIGSRYAEGRGVKVDMAKAALWYTQAAKAGLAPAEYRIGNLYEKGTGVDRDIAKAKDWYTKAAEQGNASAMHNLAVLYAMGADGTTDEKLAAKWFTKAAELGVKDSQYNLGILAAKGAGMPQNLEESYKWFALVAKTGDRDAAAKRDEVAKALRPDQLKKARATVELWKPRELDKAANIVDIPDEWTESNSRTASVDMKQAVINVQRILAKNGYDAGPADGVMGDKTRAAIKAFQKDNGMQPTGQLDEKVVRALLARK